MCQDIHFLWVIFSIDKAVNKGTLISVSKKISDYFLHVLTLFCGFYARYNQKLSAHY